MKIGVLSDTHGHIDRTLRAADAFTERGVELVIHCGDVGSAAVVELLDAWPCHYVFGNVDDYQEIRAAVARAGQTCHERFGELELAGKRIAFLHSDDRRQFDSAVLGGRYDLVCFGHTHAAELRKVGNTTLLNPGALYRTAEPSVAVVELPAILVTQISV